MSKLVELRTQGRDRIVISGANDRNSESYPIAKVRTGEIDMARVSLQALNGLVPSTAVLGTPFLFGSASQLQRVIDGPIGEEILADFEAHDLVGLCFYSVGARHLYTIDRPVRKAADVNGLRLRAQPGDQFLPIWRSLGADMVPMPASNMTGALRAKAIDGSTGNWLTYISSGHFEVARFMSLTAHSRPPGVVIFSKQTWQSLSPEEQSILRGAARESVAVARGRLGEYEIAARRNMAKQGVTIIDDVDIKSFSDPMVAQHPALFPERKQQEMLKRIQAAAGGT